MNIRGIVTALVIASLALPAFALDLHSARAAGMVVETPDGYIAAAKPSPEVNALVADVNAKRKAEVYAHLEREWPAGRCGR